MRLLLIEDDSRIVRFIKRGLEAERYLVDVAVDGQQGIDMVQVGNYDLIILDIILPITNGIQLCQHLRSQRIQTPILMLTAKDSV
ncbi:MAG: response regulator, partial [Nitrospiria bacterium]